VIRGIVNLVTQFYGEQRTMVTASTGVAATAVDGTTIHSAITFRMSKGEVVALSGMSEKKLQDKFKNILYLIIDELSMIGLEFLTLIDRRLRQAFPAHRDVPFGNLSIILVGDLGQLPPVRDKPLYADMKGLDAKYQRGGGLFRLFTTMFYLTTSHRQDGSTLQDNTFKNALERLRDGESTLAYWEFLAKRHHTNISREEYQSFMHAPRAFATKAPAAAYKLKNEEKPIAVIKSVDSGNATFYDGRLERHLLVCIGAIVMLTSNL
jgi:ATP-dependent DNA helicase PIF1